MGKFGRSIGLGILLSALIGSLSCLGPSSTEASSTDGGDASIDQRAEDIGQPDTVEAASPVDAQQEQKPTEECILQAEVSPSPKAILVYIDETEAVGFEVFLTTLNNAPCRLMRLSLTYTGAASVAKDIAAIQLFNGNKPLGSAIPLNPLGETTTFIFPSGFTIPEGTTTTLRLHLQLKLTPASNGDKHGFIITSADSLKLESGQVKGNFPLIGCRLDVSEYPSPN